MFKFEHFGFGIIKGLIVVFKQLFRGPITVQYPEKRLITSRRIRGYELIWDRDKCTGCATCAKTCPQGVIDIVTSKGDNNDYVVDKFEVDMGYCIFCGLCVEACPYEALYYDYGYEHGKYRRGDLLFSKEGLLISKDKQVSAYARPKVEKKLPKQALLIDGNKVKE